MEKKIDPSVRVPGIQDSAVILPNGHELNCPESTVDHAEDGDPILNRVRMMTQSQILQHHMEMIDETEEEAQDFDIKSDFDDQGFEESKYMEAEFPESVINDIIDDIKSKKKGQAPPIQESGAAGSLEPEGKIPADGPGSAAPAAGEK